MSWLSRFPEPVDIKQFGPIRDQAKSHPGFTRGVRQVEYQAPPCHSFVTVTGRWSIPRYTVLWYILILCIIYMYIYDSWFVYVYTELYWSLYIFLSNHLRSSNRFVDTSIGKHHQHMRCNTDVSGSKHLIRWHLSDAKSPPSLDASRMKLRPLQVEVEWSGFKKLLNTLVDFRLTSFRQVFFSVFFCCRGCTHARHSPPLWCFCGYKGRDFSQARHPNHGSSISSNTLYLYYIFIYNSCICNHIHIQLVTN